MAQTGKLGITDSQLGNMLLAFAGADDSLPSSGTMNGRLGTSSSMLGNSMPALDGPDGPKVINLTATSVLVLTQTVNSGAVLIGHAPPPYVIGSPDSQLGDFQLDFTGADDPLPTIGTQSGRLGLGLGNLVLGLDGIVGARIINLSASSTLVLVSSASCDAELVGHASPRWVLGGIDSYTGNTQLAYVEVPLRPYTGARTGELGTLNSLLGKVRLALGEEEGEGSGGPHTYNLTADNTLSLTQQASYAAIFLLDASNDLSLSSESVVTTREWLHEVSADNTIELISFALLAHEVFEVSADSTISLSSEATSTTGTWIYDLSADNTIALTQSSNRTAVRELSADSTITFTDVGWGTTGDLIDLSAENIIELLSSADTLKSVNMGANSFLMLTQNVNVGRPWHVSADSYVQETHQEFVPGTLEIIDVTTGLSSSASVNTTLNLSARSVLAVSQHAGFSFILPGGITASAENTLALSQNAWTTEVASAGNRLSLTQTAAGNAGPPVASQLNLGQSAGVTVVRNRSTDSTLSLGQRATYILIKHGAVELFDYAPATGGGPIPGTLQGPYPGVTSRFALIYPATGSATDTIELRPPNLGNKDRLSFDRINRESRGGSLTIYADPDWPKTQTLALSFSSLYRTEAYELIRFIRDHLGLEVKLSDWEQRVWKGVITTPNEPVVQDGKDSFSASFEFEGELLSA